MSYQCGDCDKDQESVEPKRYSLRTATWGVWKGGTYTEAEVQTDVDDAVKVVSDGKVWLDKVGEVLVLSDLEVELGGVVLGGVVELGGIEVGVMSEISLAPDKAPAL